MLLFLDMKERNVSLQAFKLQFLFLFHSSAFLLMAKQKLTLRHSKADRQAVRHQQRSCTAASILSYSTFLR